MPYDAIACILSPSIRDILTLGTSYSQEDSYHQGKVEKPAGVMLQACQQVASLTAAAAGSNTATSFLGF